MKTGKLVSAAFLVLLAGCSGLKSKQPPPSIYVVHAASCAGQSVAVSRLALSVPEPEVPAGFDTERIALYLQGGRRLDYYAGAAWPDHLGKMLQQVVVQTPCGIVATSEDTASGAADMLYVKVDDFEPVYAAGPGSLPQLKVAMTFRLVTKDPDRTLLDFTLQQQGDAPANTLTGVAQGLETLSRSLLAQAFQQIEPKLAEAARKRRAHPVHSEAAPAPVPAPPGPGL